MAFPRNTIVKSPLDDMRMTFARRKNTDACVPGTVIRPCPFQYF